ncbi:signal recognition particle-docking protein FtsY, partial [Enterococcus hirae]
DGMVWGGIFVVILVKYKLLIYFIGVGEGVDDLEFFVVKDFVCVIVGVV